MDAKGSGLSNWCTVMQDPSLGFKRDFTFLTIAFLSLNNITDDCTKDGGAWEV